MDKSGRLLCVRYEAPAVATARVIDAALFVTSLTIEHLGGFCVLTINLTYADKTLTERETDRLNS